MSLFRHDLCHFYIYLYLYFLVYHLFYVLLRVYIITSVMHFVTFLFVKGNR